MHMPGHKGLLPMQWMNAAYDQTETALTDDLFAPEGAIARAQALYAACAGAANTLFLTGGATSGMMAMVLSSVTDGGKIILPRNAHHSAVSACVWGDLTPAFVSPRMEADGSVYVDDADVLAAMEENPDAQAVLITRPDYYGRCIPLDNIIAKAKEMAMCVLVDEAHGAHFPWQTHVEAAMACGADMCVQSTHKTLPALTGGAVLHLREGIDGCRVRRVLRMVHSSSPSFLIMETLDSARAWMEEYSVVAMNNLKKRIRHFWEILDPSYTNAQKAWSQPCDPLRLVVDVRRHGYTGWEVLEYLKEQGVDIEMADERRIVLIPSTWDKDEWLLCVAQALNRLEEKPGLVASQVEALPLPLRVMPLRRAARSRGEAVDLQAAQGRISQGSVGIYPPGVPLVMPGERFTPECIVRLCAAPEALLFGVEAGSVICVEEDSCATM